MLFEDTLQSFIHELKNMRLILNKIENWNHAESHLSCLL